MPRITRILLLAVVAGLAGLDAVAQTGTPKAAPRTTSRIEKPPEFGFLLTPWPGTGAQVLQRLDGQKAIFLDVNRPKLNDGVFRYRITGNGIEVNDAEMGAFGAPAFWNSVLFAKMLAARPNSGSVVQQGLAALDAYSLLYPTDYSWSLVAKEEVALVYFLRATGGDPGDDAAVKRALGSYLPEQHKQDGKLVGDLATRLTRLKQEEVERAATAGVDDDCAEGGFCLLEALSPNQTRNSHVSQPFPAYDQKAATKLLEQLLADRDLPKRYPHLPGLYRLVRRLIEVSGNEDLARATAKTADDPEAKSARERLEDRRKMFVRWLDEEVERRWKSAQESRPKAIARTTGGLWWDPHAVAELTALLIETSVPHARRIRLADKIAPDKAAKQIEEVFKEDELLGAVFAAYGKPAVAIVPSKVSERGALVLRWDIPLVGARDVVSLRMESAMSRGGMGLPIELGLIATLPVQVKSGDVSRPAQDITLRQVGAGNWLESEADPQSGISPQRRRWMPVMQAKPFSSQCRVDVELEDGTRIAGTPPQKVWALKGGRSNWEWTPLADLGEGDQLMHHDGRPRGVRWAKQSEDKSSEFVECLVANTSNFYAGGILVEARREEIVADSDHGLEQSTLLSMGTGAETRRVPIASAIPNSAQASDLSEPNYATCIGYSTQTRQVVANRDALVATAPDQRQVIYAIAFTNSAGQASKISTGCTHGFLVDRKGQLKEAQARELQVGDRLVSDADGGRVTVTAVAQEIDREGKKLRHPKLAGGPWIQANGVLVHTDEPDPRLIAFPAATAIQTVVAPSERESTPVPVFAQEVRIAELAAQARGEAKLWIAACWPGAGASGSEAPSLLSRPVARVGRTLYPWMSCIITDKSRKLYTTPGTHIWAAVREAPSMVQPRPARDLLPGDLVVVLKNGGLALERVVYARSRITADQEVPGQGYLEVYCPLFPQAQYEAEEAVLRHYDNIFANGVLVHLAGRGEGENDPKPRIGFRGQGGGGGQTPGRPDGLTQGAPSRAGVVDSISTSVKQDVTGRAEEYRTFALEIRPDDAASLQRSEEKLKRALDQLPKRPLQSRLEGAALQRWERFAEVCLASSQRDPQRALSLESLKSASREYLAVRGLVTGTNCFPPDRLALLARKGIQLAYMAREAGAPETGAAVLGDLVVIQMRLALRNKPGSLELWGKGDALVRDTIRFAMELSRLESQAKPGESAASRFWDVAWPVEGWDDLLSLANLHEDIWASPAKRDSVKLYDLILQLDARTAQGPLAEPLHGFLMDRFEAGREFAGEEFRSRFQTQPSKE